MNDVESTNRMGRLDGSLPHAACDDTQAVVHLTRWGAEDERDDSISRNFDVLEGAQYMDLTAAATVSMRLSENGV